VSALDKTTTNYNSPSHWPTHTQKPFLDRFMAVSLPFHGRFFQMFLVLVAHCFTFEPRIALCLPAA
jgi:hypothetical protein